MLYAKAGVENNMRHMNSASQGMNFGIMYLVIASALNIKILVIATAYSIDF